MTHSGTADILKCIIVMSFNANLLYMPFFKTSIPMIPPNWIRRHILNNCFQFLVSWIMIMTLITIFM